MKSVHRSCLHATTTPAINLKSSKIKYTHFLCNTKLVHVLIGNNYCLCFEGWI